LASKIGRENHPINWEQCDQKFEENDQFCGEKFQIFCPTKKRQRFYTKDLSESPKHLHLTIFEMIKYLQQIMF
jgi:hypothetical protein